MTTHSIGTVQTAIDYLKGLLEDGCTGTDTYITITHDGDTCPVHEVPEDERE